MEEVTYTYKSFEAIDINALAALLNAFVEGGGTISSISISVDKGIAYAIALVSESEN